jgi:hypothetical protein
MRKRATALFLLVTATGRLSTGGSSDGVSSTVGSPPVEVQVLADRQLNTGGIAFDGTSVYWSTDLLSNGNTTIWKMDLGTRTPQVVQSGESAAFSFNAVGTTVFWRSSPGVAVLTSGAARPRNIETPSCWSYAPEGDGQAIFYVPFGSSNAGGSQFVYSRSLTDTASTLLYDGGLNTVLDVAVVGNTVYMASTSGVLALASGQSNPRFVAGQSADSIGCVTADSVFFTSYGEMYGVPISAGEDPTRLGSGDLVGCDGDYLYVILHDPSSNARKLARVPFGQGDAQVLLDPAPPAAASYFVARDALYVQDPGTTAAAKTNGRILRIPR